MLQTHRIHTCIPCELQHSSAAEGRQRQFNTDSATEIVMSLSQNFSFPADWKTKIRTGSTFLGKTLCASVSDCQDDWVLQYDEGKEEPAKLECLSCNPKRLSTSLLNLETSTKFCTIWSEKKRNIPTTLVRSWQHKINDVLWWTLLHKKCVTS